MRGKPTIKITHSKHIWQCSWDWSSDHGFIFIYLSIFEMLQALLYGGWTRIPFCISINTVQFFLLIFCFHFFPEQFHETFSSFYHLLPILSKLGLQTRVVFSGWTQHFLHFPNPQNLLHLTSAGLEHCPWQVCASPFLQCLQGFPLQKIILTISY